MEKTVRVKKIFYQSGKGSESAKSLILTDRGIKVYSSTVTEVEITEEEIIGLLRKLDKKRQKKARRFALEFISDLLTVLLKENCDGKDK